MKRNYLWGLALTAVMLMCGVSFADTGTGYTADTAPVFEVMPTSSQPGGDVVLSQEDSVLGGDFPNVAYMTTNYFSVKTPEKATYVSCAWTFEPIAKPMKVPITI